MDELFFAVLCIAGVVVFVEMIHFAGFVVGAAVYAYMDPTPVHYIARFGWYWGGLRYRYGEQDILDAITAGNRSALSIKHFVEKRRMFPVGSTSHSDLHHVLDDLTEGEVLTAITDRERKLYWIKAR